MAQSVLIVDDEPNIVLSLEFLMQQAGHEVEVAESGKAALDAVEKSIPDLILLDIMIPRPDGYEVCRHLKSDTKTKNVPIIILSAKGRESERDQGMAAGADDYVTKPFSNHDLVSRVENILKSKG